MEAFVDRCPDQDPATVQINADFHILRNGVPVTFVNCTEPVTAMLASPDLDVIRIRQTLRLIYQMDVDAPVRLPWTSLRMYDWIKSKIAGVNIDTTSGNSYCCVQFSGGLYFGYGVFGATDFSRVAGLKTDGLIGLVALFGHEVRHVDGYGHSSCCGVANGCDPTYDETNLSAYGVQYYLYRLFLQGGINLNIQCLDPPAARQVVDSLLLSENLYPARFCDQKPAMLARSEVSCGACLPGNIPHVSPGGAINAASFQADANVPGGIISLFGTGLASSVTSASMVPLPRALAGVSVEIGGIPAPLFVVTPNQINAQIPFEVVPSQAVPVQVKTKNAAGFTYSFVVNKEGPGIFPVVQNEDYSVNDASHPAAVGSVITVYFTGLGKLDHAVMTGAAAPVTPISRTQASVTSAIGNVGTEALFVGLTPGAVGLAQANLRVPALSTGRYAVTFTLDGVAANSASVVVWSPN